MENEKAKHTPGPWRIGDAGKTVFGPPNGKPAPEVIATGKSHENIRLCAAAPELLAALERILECHRLKISLDTNAAALEQARAAIRKAKGE